MWDRASNRVGSITGTVAFGSGVGGAYATFNDSVHSNIGWADEVLSGSDVTVLAVGHWTSGGGQQTVFSQRYNDGSNFPQLNFAVNTDLNFGASAGKVSLLGYNAGYHSIETNTSAITGALGAYAARMPGSGVTNAKFSINGITSTYLNSATGATTWGNTNQKVTVGNFADNSGTGYATDEPLYLVMAWDYMVPDGMFEEITINPWQVFQPRIQRLYFGVGGATEYIGSSSGTTSSAVLAAMTAAASGTTGGTVIPCFISTASGTTGGGFLSASTAASAGSASSSVIAAFLANASGLAEALGYDAGNSIASSDGTSTATGYAAFLGTIDGTSTVTGVSGNVYVGEASGAAVVVGISGALFSASGAASSDVISAFTGSSSGTGTVTGRSPSTASGGTRAFTWVA